MPKSCDRCIIENYRDSFFCSYFPYILVHCSILGRILPSFLNTCLRRLNKYRDQKCHQWRLISMTPGYEGHISWAKVEIVTGILSWKSFLEKLSLARYYKEQRKNEKKRTKKRLNYSQVILLYQRVHKADLILKEDTKTFKSQFINFQSHEKAKKKNQTLSHRQI